MSLPQVVAVVEHSAAERFGLRPGDELVSLNGCRPRDVIEYQLLADEAVVEIEVVRQGANLTVTVTKQTGEPLGLEVSDAVFDRVRTCDNRCDFCFVRQLPKGLRASLYCKDDDYRLSFLYGNFTTLTRFTESDLERVVDERLSPLYVSIHATDPELRARMLHNRRGATSLRWLRCLLDEGIEVHGQIVVCPGVNDGAHLHETLADVLDSYPSVASLAVVPVGVSRYCTEANMRPHTHDEAREVLATVEEWQQRFQAGLGRRVVWASDEYYLLAKAAFPKASEYEGFALLENGVGMVRSFEMDFAKAPRRAARLQPKATTTGGFTNLEGARAWGYRALRAPGATLGHEGARNAKDGPPSVITSLYGEEVLRGLLDRHGFGKVRVLAVPNEFFGGNVAVTGLLTGEDISRVLAKQSPAGRYLLPDVCLSAGRFLDGSAVADLPVAVEIVPSDGAFLRAVLEEVK